MRGNKSEDRDFYPNQTRSAPFKVELKSISWLWELFLRAGLGGLIYYFSEVRVPFQRWVEGRFFIKLLFPQNIKSMTGRATTIRTKTAQQSRILPLSYSQFLAQQFSSLWPYSSTSAAETKLALKIGVKSIQEIMIPTGAIGFLEFSSSM
jgi:hypothetical protein